VSGEYEAVITKQKDDILDKNRKIEEVNNKVKLQRDEMLNRINQLREALAKLQAEFFKYKALIEGSMIDVLKRKKDDDDENDRDRENKKKEREQMQLTFEAKINSLKTELNLVKAENDKLTLEKNNRGEAELNNQAMGGKKNMKTDQIKHSEK